jgi:hypothetical protein
VDDNVYDTSVRGLGGGLVDFYLLNIGQSPRDIVVVRTMISRVKVGASD